MSTATTLALVVALVIAVAGAVVWRKASSDHDAITLYKRLGGVYPIASVIDDFSEAVLKSPVVGVDSPNPQLRDWSRNQSAARLPGLKFMRTLWVSDAAGGPLKFHGTHGSPPDRLNLEEAHRHLRITPAEFDETANILAATLDRHNVPAAEKAAVLGAFSAHKAEVTAGSM